MFYRPEEQVAKEVDSRNRFVDGRVCELVETLLNYYRSLPVEHFTNTRVQRTNTTYTYIICSHIICSHFLVVEKLTCAETIVRRRQNMTFVFSFCGMRLVPEKSVES